MSVEERAPAGGVRGRLLDLMFVRGRVEEVTPGPGRMRWIAVAGVPGLDWTPGQQVRVHVADITSARTWVSGAVLQSLRTYSVWDYDASAGVMRLCVMDHEAGGPGTRWARDLRPGREVVFGKPEGRFGLRPADYHVFAGEETASVAFGAMLRAAQPDEPVHGVIEVAGRRGPAAPPEGGGAHLAPPRGRSGRGLGRARRRGPRARSAVRTGNRLRGRGGTHRAGRPRAPDAGTRLAAQIRAGQAVLDAGQARHGVSRNDRRARGLRGDIS
ncbi:siderophore-interacting protein [Actinomadura madurae]|uniref:siderophore-interacting protein n=1 Tax=Actinomadura madurae TaxID=1993 RepID=UPI0020D25999|nr:siderophore-interacting protein [Actinomadura madurae]MCQ0021310.1 siderophore-interacting protein [Actinomadura madurae]